MGMEMEMKMEMQMQMKAIGLLMANVWQNGLFTPSFLSAFFPRT